MRGNPIIGRRISNPSTKQSLFLSSSSSPSSSSSSSFSTSSSGGGRGLGRGRGDYGPSSQFDFSGRAPGKPESREPPSPQQQQPMNRIGHGRGKPILPAFSSFVSSIGRGHPAIEPNQAIPSKIQFTQQGEPTLPPTVQSAVSEGAGRGKPEKQPVAHTPPTQGQENRHIRVRPSTSKPRTRAEETRVQPKISREEAVRRAVSILSQGGDNEGIGRGRGRGRGGRGRGRGRGREWERGRMDDLEEGLGSGLFLGDNADGEKLAEKVGIENMNKLIEGFEEMSGRVLPSPMEDAYLDALHTNYMVSE